MTRVLLILILTLLLSLQLGAQVLYSPQINYDAPLGFYDHDSLRTIYINFYDPGYDAILDANWVADNGLRIPASVTLSNGEHFDSVAVRYKGNSTYAIARDNGNPKLPLNIDVNGYILGQELLGYKKIKLANALFDPTFVKEINAYNIYQRYLPSPEANFMKVYVQGNYLGLYINTESVSGQFCKKHFNEKDGTLIKCDPVQQFGQPGPTGNSDLTWLGPDTTLYYNHYDLKSPSGWGDLVNLINILNNNPNQLESVLNIDRVLWAFAVNSVITNLDVYNGLYIHNYYLYKTGDGLFQMIPWDASESFLGALLGNNPDPTLLYEYDPYNGYNCWWYPLVTELISDPTSQTGQIYTAHMKTIIKESLIANEISAFTADLQANAYDAANTDNNKFFDMLTYYNNVNNEFVIPSIFSAGGIISTIDLRKPFLEMHPGFAYNPPEISNVSYLNIDDEIYVTAKVSGGSNVELMTTTSIYNSKFISSQMADNGSSGDLMAGDSIFTVKLPNQNGQAQVKFYIRASNADAISLNPERAEYEFYTFTPDSETTTPFFGVSIYPNPSNSVVTIETMDPEVTLDIYDMFGHLVMSDYNNQSTLTVDISTLAQAIYLFKVNGSVKRVMKTD
jgi:hypothetical protein